MRFAGLRVSRSAATVAIASVLAVTAMISPASATPVQARPAYHMFAVNVPSKSALARDINAAGDVVGSFVARDGLYHAFYTSGRKVIDLGRGDGYAINDLGQVTGVLIGPDSYRAFYTTTDGQVVDIGEGFGYDINDAGQVVGVASGQPFLYSEGARQVLPTLDGGGFPNAINEAGQIVGQSEWGRPFLYDATGLHDLRAEISAAGDGQYLIWGLHDINDQGQVIGELYPASGGTGEAFTYDLGTGAFRVLTPLIPGDFTYPGGINDEGQIVGWARPVGTSGSGLIHAVLWTGTEVHDLGTLGGADSTAYAINEDGVVTGGAALRSGIDRVYRLATR